MGGSIQSNTANAQKTELMIGDLLRNHDGTTSNTPSPKIMEDIKKVIVQGHAQINKQVMEADARLRDDLDQVAMQCQEVSQAMDDLTKQVASRADGGANWSRDPGRNGEREHSPNPKKKLDGPADAPTDRTISQNDGFPIGGLSQLGAEATMGVSMSPLACKWSLQEQIDIMNQPFPATQDVGWTPQQQQQLQQQVHQQQLRQQPPSQKPTNDQ